MSNDRATQSEFEAALLAMDRLAAARLLASPDQATPPLQRVERLVVPVLDRIGQAWDQGRTALAQVYMCGRICEDLVDALLPADNVPRKDQPTMAIALLEDSHLLGKRMVYATLRASGYALRDYGRLDTESLIERTCEDGTQGGVGGHRRIFHEALTCQTEEDLGRTCLKVAEQVTQSKFGFIGEINPATGNLDAIAISDPGWESCRMAQPIDQRTIPIGLISSPRRIVRDMRRPGSNRPAN